ncbi:MAG: hypothetical protein ABI867_44565 [Kofleriaceae bacterium]
MTPKQVLRRALPWFVGVAIVVMIFVRVPLEAFRQAIHEGPHLQLAAVDLGVTLLMLTTDTLATWIAMRVTGARWTLGRVLAVRGATYVLSILNYAVGQGGIGFYLHRGGVPAKRAAGITLFMMGTTLATLLVVTAATLASEEITYAAMGWTVLAGCIGFVGYLIVIAIAPAALAGRELLAPLFEAGLRGHGIAIVGRVPHVLVVVLGHWFAMIAWGIPVPFGVAIAVLPVVVIAAVLPISPAGLGTTQAALVYFFAAYAAGADGDARAASILAFSIVHFVYGMIGQLVVGAVCVPFAKRASPPSAPSD